ncbi:hypothetical protein KKF32_02960 [Patescibacteria group bacterium]|nr:hypothetical protein [Patescibacteria group bacterium]
MILDLKRQKKEDLLSELEVGASKNLPETPERPVPVEIKPEQQLEEEKGISPEKEFLQKPPVVSKPPEGSAAVQAKTTVAQDSVYTKVEKILEENLDELYLNMPQATKEEFRKKGEETATKVSQLLKTTKVKVKEIFRLIVSWLKIIPGINRFFLEQEAKIKTGKIMSIKNKDNVG